MRTALVSIALAAGACGESEAPSVVAVADTAADRSSAPAPTRAQQITGNQLIDDDYAFVLTAPADSWQIQGEAEVRAVCTDAIAGIEGPLGGVVHVQVWNAPGTSVEQFVEPLIPAADQVADLQRTWTRGADLAFSRPFSGWDGRRPSHDANC